MTVPLGIPEGLREKSLASRWIILAFLCPRVENLEVSVRLRCQFEVVRLIGAGRIGDKFRSGVVSRATFLGEMQLPKILDVWRPFDDFPHRGSAPFFRSIVHDGHARSDAVDENWTTALRPSVMRHDVNIDPAEFIDWAHQFRLLVIGQVPQVKDSQLAERDYDSQRAKVFCLIDGILL